MRFDGTIIITDPCYITEGKNDMWDDPDIDIFTGAGSGKHFSKYIWENTIYGDWSCTTFKIKDESAKKKSEELKASDMEDDNLGQFCADAGLVGVFLLDEVLKVNPKFNYHTERKWTTTVIEDFHGDIEYVVLNGEDAHIRGTGNVNFITSQTGM